MIYQNETNAWRRVLRISLVDTNGNGISPTLASGDMKVLQFGGALVNAVNLPVAVPGATAGAFTWQVDATEVAALGPLYYQVTHTGVRPFFDWELIETPTADVSQLIANLLATNFDATSPFPNFKTVGQLLNVLASYLAGNANGFPLSVQQQLTYPNLAGTKTRLAGAIANGLRTITAADGT